MLWKNSSSTLKYASKELETGRPGAHVRGELVTERDPGSRRWVQDHQQPPPGKEGKSLCPAASLGQRTLPQCRLLHTRKRGGPEDTGHLHGASVRYADSTTAGTQLAHEGLS